MATTIGFDVYGTLIDTHGVIVALKRYVGDRATEFSRIWREKQLEYSFRRALMQNYADFSVCTRDALEYAAAYFGVELNSSDRESLMNVYRVLPVFDDVREGLTLAREAGFKLFAFSNGRPDALETLLQNADIRDYFIDLISVDEMRTFKPSPAVYSYFLRRAATPGADAWLVSSNPFDVMGAISAGLRGAWVKRCPDALYDPWGIEPTVQVESLRELAGAVRQAGQ